MQEAAAAAEAVAAEAGGAPMALDGLLGDDFDDHDASDLSDDRAGSTPTRGEATGIAEGPTCDLMRGMDHEG